MTRTVFLLRHGKSSWADPTLTDHQRPLAKRGRKDSRRMGAEMAARGWHPGLALCSTAKRTRQTFKRLAKGLGEGGGAVPEVRFEKGLYLADDRYLVERLRRLDDAERAVLLVGHQPGMYDLACGLTGRHGTGLRDDGGDGFPTAALAVIELSAARWAEAAAGQGRLLAFLRPRALP